MNGITRLRYKEFPGAWQERPLGSLAEFSKGRGYSKRDLTEIGTPAILYGRLYTQYEFMIRRVDTCAAPQAGSVYSTGREVIVPASGETAEDIARASFICPPDVLIGGDLNILTPDEDIDPAFLALAISNGSAKRELSKRAQGKTIVHIHNDDLKSICVPLPSSKEEQTRIAALFASIDRTLNAMQKRCDALEKGKLSLWGKLFPKLGRNVPEVRFSGFTGDWTWRALGKIGDTYTGLSGKAKEDFGHGDAQFVTYMNVFSNPIASPVMTEAVVLDKNQNQVSYGDVFFTGSSETPEEVGMSSVWLYDAANTYLNSFCFGYRPKIGFDPYYLAYMLRSPAVRKEISFLAQGISRYNISKTKMMEIEVPIPAMEEQKKIGTFFRTTDRLIALQRLEIQKLKALRQGMLDRMFY